MKYWLLILWLIGQPAWGQIRPAPGAGDVRLQTVIYDPEQVVRLDVASGYQLMVSFAPGERIETIAVGDSTAWQVSTNKRGDYLFIKIVQPSEGTNLTVVTDARVYSFELARAPYAGGDLPFKVQFVYPEATKAATV
ncbi:MAG: TrbG/VirB9 family P-type conjugative transfer protein, partial [Chakrabartia sp.]